METTNSIKHRIITKDIDGNFLHIDIRLNDECRNGHNDFAITASAYDKKGKGSTADKWHLYGGCAHDEILKAMPSLKLFVDLHLSDAKGNPMHASANGFYHLKEGKLNYCQSTIRATDEEMKIIVTAEDELHFKYLIESLGIVARWQIEANAGIAELEKLTGKTFKDDSVRYQYEPLTDDERKLITERLQYGYYTPERIAERATAKAQAKKQKAFARLVDDRDKAVKKAENEYAVKCAVLMADIDINDAIYYDHTNELVFNWHGKSFNSFSDNVTREQFDAFVASVDMNRLPKGIKFKLAYVK